MNTTLTHHGILGQKWGVRRYQNEDGTLTSAGKRKLLKEARKDREAFRKEEEEKEKSKDTALNRSIKTAEMWTKVKSPVDDDSEKPMTLDAALKNALVNKISSKLGGDMVPTQENMEKALKNMMSTREQIINKRVSERMLEKYGQETMDQLEKSDRFRKGATGVAALMFVLYSGAKVAENAPVDRVHYRQYGEWEGEKRRQ